jgi:hypothetical protein
MQTAPGKPAPMKTIPRLMGWTRTSYYLFSAFLAIILLIIIVWWPLVVDYFSQIDPAYPIWQQLDWLLIGIFAFMSLAIMAGANLKTDAWIVFIGICGGLVIEGWGTQTRIWTYFTNERPPLWIIPAWPIASLTIDRMVRIMDRWLPPFSSTLIHRIYWVTFACFYLLMAWFVWPTIEKPLTILALISCALLIITPGDRRLALITFSAGTALGLFLEIWGTTRLCWTYYTHETPPVFAVFAHGLAGFAFWRVGWLFREVIFLPVLRHPLFQRRNLISDKTKLP